MRQIKQTRDGNAPGWTLFQDLPMEPPAGDHEKLDRALELATMQAKSSAQGTASDNIVPGGLFDPALAPPSQRSSATSCGCSKAWQNTRLSRESPSELDVLALPRPSLCSGAERPLTGLPNLYRGCQNS